MKFIRSFPSTNVFRTVGKIGYNKSPKQAESVTPSLGKMKDELFLITFFIICSGLVYTDSYYQQFGIKYQFLNLSIMDIIYRGLTLILHYPSILIPYFIAIIAMVAEIIYLKRGAKKILDFRIPFAYIFLFANLLIIYPIADHAGREQALVDMKESTTGLPKIIYLEAPQCELKLQYPSQKFALFSNNSDLIFYFELATNGSTRPIIKSIKKSDIKFLDISR